jgi:hypothetical protein
MDEDIYPHRDRARKLTRKLVDIPLRGLWELGGMIHDVLYLEESWLEICYMYLRCIASFVVCIRTFYVTGAVSLLNGEFVHRTSPIV